MTHASSFSTSVEPKKRPCLSGAASPDLPAEAFVKCVAGLTLPEGFAQGSLFDPEDAQMTLARLITKARKIRADIDAERTVEQMPLKGEAIVKDLGLDRAFLGSVPFRRIDRNLPNREGELRLNEVLWVEYLRNEEIVRVVAEAPSWRNRKTFVLDASDASIDLVKSVIDIARSGDEGYLTDENLAGLAPFLVPRKSLAIERKF